MPGARTKIPTNYFRGTFILLRCVLSHFERVIAKIRPKLGYFGYGPNRPIFGVNRGKMGYHPLTQKSGTLKISAIGGQNMPHLRIFEFWSRLKDFWFRVEKPLITPPPLSRNPL